VSEACAEVPAQEASVGVEEMLVGPREVAGGRPSEEPLDDQWRDEEDEEAGDQECDRELARRGRRVGESGAAGPLHAHRDTAIRLRVGACQR